MRKTLFSIISILVAISVLMPYTIVSASAEEFLLGDIDGDGSLTAVDALIILRYSVSLEDLTEAQKKIADINCDGNIDAADALLTLRTSVGLTDDDISSVEIFKDYAVKILNYINAERTNAGVEPLTLDETLCTISDKRAEEISYRESLAHVRRDGSACRLFLTNTMLLGITTVKISVQLQQPK